MTRLEKAAAWILAILWLSPLLYAFWAAFHPPEFATTFEPLAPLTLGNFEKAWGYAPFPRHFLNTVMLVTMILAAQLVLCTLAGFAFARFDFAGRDIAFALVLLQLMIMPEVLIVENYSTMSRLAHQTTIATWQSRSGRRERLSSTPPACTETMTSAVFSAVNAPEKVRLEPVSSRNDGRNDTTSW